MRCRVKIQVNEAMIQIIIGRYKKKSISLFILAPIARQANVAPVFKKGEKYDAANY